MKALAIFAGARKDGATDNLLDAVIKGLKETGAQTEKVYLYDLDIKPCQGCLSCEKTGRCRIDDDHPKLLDKMDSADIVVFGSPTYWSNVTSVAKAFFDRSLGFFKMAAFGPRRFAKNPSRVILLTSCGAPFPFSHLMGIIPGSVRTMKAFFGCMNASIEVLAATGMMRPDSRPGAKLLEKAYQLGKKETEKKGTASFSKLSPM